MLLITSNVHQMFDCYAGTAGADEGKRIRINDPIGQAEDNRIPWQPNEHPVASPTAMACD